MFFYANMLGRVDEFDEIPSNEDRGAYFRSVQKRVDDALLYGDPGKVLNSFMSVVVIPGMQDYVNLQETRNWNLPPAV